MALAMTIGSVTLLSFEVPERLEDLGGMVVIERHDFPGGIRTIQPFGAFPNVLRWQGIMTGTFALPRIATLDQIRLAQQPVTLSYGPKVFTGILTKLKVQVRSQWLVRYEAEFVPSEDLSNSQQPSFGSYTALLNDQALYLQEMYNGAIGYGIPADLLEPTSGLITALGLFTSQVAQPSAPNAGASIVSAANALNTASAADMNSSDSATAATASDLNARSNVIAVLAASASTGWVVEVINPNLYTLAAQYYGDATDWEMIAQANGLVDPMPIGEFTLTIPAPPS